MDRPKVFISYSWKSEEYKDVVLQLARRLRSNGVDVILDRWHLRAGHDMYDFMERSIREADKVLVLCEQSYVEKANARAGGAGTETRIISPALYPDSRQEKVIPVFMESHRVVPDFLKGRMGIPFASRSEAEYKEMLRVIYGVPEVDIPALGQPPAWLTKRSTAGAPGQAVTLPIAEPEDELPPISPVEEAPVSRPTKPESEPLPVSCELSSSIVWSPFHVGDFDFESTPEGTVITKYSGKGGDVKIPSAINDKPVIKIAQEAFDFCKTLQSVWIPDSVTAIGTRAFNHCIALRAVRLSAGLKRIGNSAFCECSSLVSVEIPEGVTSIGQWAFDGCDSLNCITLPKSVRSIGVSAFDTPSLKSVFYNGTEAQWDTIQIDEKNEALTKAAIYLINAAIKCP